MWMHLFVPFFSLVIVRETSSLGTCKISGDPHVITFDGKHFDFSAYVCSYYLLQYQSHMNIIANTQRCHHHRTCLESLTIKLIGLDGIKYYVIEMGQKHALSVNGLNVTTPYESTDVEITTTNRRSHAKFSNGVSVIWDNKKAAEIIVNNTYVGFLQGLCGNFNQDPSDDFMLDYGITLTREDFIHNWKTDFSCNVSP